MLSLLQGGTGSGQSQLTKAQAALLCLQPVHNWLRLSGQGGFEGPSTGQDCPCPLKQGQRLRTESWRGPAAPGASCTCPLRSARLSLSNPTCERSSKTGHFPALSWPGLVARPLWWTVEVAAASVVGVAGHQTLSWALRTCQHTRSQRTSQRHREVQLLAQGHTPTLVEPGFELGLSAPELRSSQLASSQVQRDGGAGGRKQASAFGVSWSLGLPRGKFGHEQGEASSDRRGEWKAVKLRLVWATCPGLGL